MTLRFVALALLLASLVNITPLLVANVGGDIDFHLAMIKCFAGQFWQGDFYPRWCMAANAGSGSPTPLFYFPLPYYAATLIYPLSHLGVSVRGVYVLSLFLVTFVSGLACYSWLKDVVSPPRALLAAILFLFMPYRMEAMLFRSSYAELWGMALLPLVFQYTRRLLTSPSPPVGEGGMGGNSPRVQVSNANHHSPLPNPPPQGGREPFYLAAVFGLLFITHLPSAAVAVLFSGIYMLVMSHSARLKLYYGISLLSALALAAFYLVPTLYYKHFLSEVSLFQGVYGWPNTYVTISNFTVLGQKRQIIMMVLTLLSLAIVSVLALRRRMSIPDPFVRREIIAWSAFSGMALFLLFPISAPFYALLGPLSQVVFPWRMQNIFMLALAFLLAVLMQWCMSERRMKTWQGDYAILLAFLALTAYFSLGVRDENSQALAEKIRPVTPLMPEEYRTRWTDGEHFGLHYFFPRWEHKGDIKSAETISGKGGVAVEHWAWDGIVLHAQSAHGITVRLNHTYFPVWSAQADDGEPVTLRPEQASGQMLLDIPAGKHRVRLHYAVSTANPWLIWISDAVSAVVFLGLFAARRKWL